MGKRAKARCAIRKRFTTKKTHRRLAVKTNFNVSQLYDCDQVPVPESCDVVVSKDGEVIGLDKSSDSFPNSAEVSSPNNVSITSVKSDGVAFEASTDTHQSIMDFHNYAKTVQSETSNLDRSDDDKFQDPADDLCPAPPPSTEEIPLELLLHTKDKIALLLPKNWMSMASSQGINVLCLSRGEELAIQRRVFISVNGSISISVHTKLLSAECVADILKSCEENVGLTWDSVDAFVDRVVKVISVVRSYEVCAGNDNAAYKSFWKDSDSAYIDRNPYLECRYEETLRATKCRFLVHVRRWRCDECTRLCDLYRKKKHFSEDDSFSLTTANEKLTEKQKLDKLRHQHTKIRNLTRKCERLTEKMNLLLKEDGVQLDDDLSKDLSDTLLGAKMSPLQSLFFHQQCKAASAKKRCGMRWHPTLIRFALHIKMLSSSAYHAIQASGMITLPSDRTLYDYSHVIEQTDGVRFGNVEKLAEEVKALLNDYQKYHVLLFDEMHISKRLVYKKSTGEVVGYVKLDEVKEELNALDQFLASDKIEPSEPSIASKVLCYMIKGTASHISSVVAYYPTANLTKEDLFKTTWDVINKLEMSGIRVCAIVCDGCEVNRSFFKMHEPYTKVAGGIVFDTIHLVAPNRLIYFLSDVAHLLKTIRNCFANSGDGKKCTRLLMKNGQSIVWKTIIRLFFTYRKSTLRKTWKLNRQNVFLNSYSCMNVGYAAQVLSASVAEDLRSQNWDGTEETINFIQLVNNVFDMLNGACLQQSVKRNNKNLGPYTSPDDGRFEYLRNFLNYLDEWSEEVSKTPNLSKTESQKRLLSRQTIEGFHITVNSFIGVVKFLLKAGTKFINARVFSQDTIEHNFSRQRGSCGGSTNPNILQFGNNQNKIDILKEVGSLKKRSLNIETGARHMEITEEPMPKRKYTRPPSCQESSTD